MQSLNQQIYKVKYGEILFFFRLSRSQKKLTIWCRPIRDCQYVRSISISHVSRIWILKYHLGMRKLSVIWVPCCSQLTTNAIVLQLKGVFDVLQSIWTSFLLFRNRGRNYVLCESIIHPRPIKHRNNGFLWAHWCRSFK